MGISDIMLQISSNHHALSSWKWQEWAGSNQKKPGQPLEGARGCVFKQEPGTPKPAWTHCYLSKTTWKRHKHPNSWEKNGTNISNNVPKVMCSGQKCSQMAPWRQTADPPRPASRQPFFLTGTYVFCEKDRKQPAASSSLVANLLAGLAFLASNPPVIRVLGGTVPNLNSAANSVGTVPTKPHHFK